MQNRKKEKQVVGSLLMAAVGYPLSVCNLSKPDVPGLYNLNIRVILGKTWCCKQTHRLASTSAMVCAPPSSSHNKRTVMIRPIIPNLIPMTSPMPGIFTPCDPPHDGKQNHHASAPDGQSLWCESPGPSDTLRGRDLRVQCPGAPTRQSPCHRCQ